MAKSKQTNKTTSYNRTEDITPEEVRSLERFKNASDEEIDNLIKTIKTYVHFIYNVVSKRQKKIDDLNQQQV